MAQVKFLKLNGGDLQQGATTDDLTFNSWTLGSGGPLVKNSSGTILIRNNADSADAPLQVSDLTVSGNLTVSGTTTTINTETINLADNLIVLNSNATGAASENGGIEVERGDDTNVQVLWNETTDRWQAGVVGSLSNIILATSTDLDTRYYTETEIGTASGTTGSDLVGDDNNYSNFTPAAATVKGALSGIDTALGAISSTNLKTSYTAGVGGISQYNAVYISANNTVLKAAASGIATARCIGFANAAITAAASGAIVTDGLITGIGSAWTAGAAVYLSATAGALTQTAPSTSGQVVLKVGIAKNATDLQIKIGEPIILV